MLPFLPPKVVRQAVIIYLHVFLSYALDFLFYPPNVTTTTWHNGTTGIGKHIAAAECQEKERWAD